jgi:cytochrome bd-type quinol oxidase subunit 2
MNKQRIIVLVAAGVGLLSCFMTWATVGVSFFSMSVNGVKSGWGGKIALLGFILAIVFALLGDRNQPIEKDKKKFVMIGGIIALVMTLLAMVGMSFQEGSSMVTFGIGIYISLIAGIALSAMPFVIKDSGDFEMPTKDALVDDLKEMKDDIVEDVKDVAHDVADKAKDLKEDVKDKFDGKDDKGE